MAQKFIKIGNRKIDPDFVIAEIGINHEGSMKCGLFKKIGKKEEERIHERLLTIEESEIAL